VTYVTQQRMRNYQVVMITSHLLFSTSQSNNNASQNEANGNFCDASVERFDSVRINRMMSPSDAIDLGCPCNSLFEFPGGSPVGFYSGVILTKIV